MSNLYPHDMLWFGFSRTMGCQEWKTYQLIFNIAEYPDNGLPNLHQPWPQIFVHVLVDIGGTHSVEYNWPLIPGSKATAAQCQVAYQFFFMNMLITWIHYASRLQCFVTLLPTGVVSEISPLMLINFERATTNFFCF